MVSTFKSGTSRRIFSTGLNAPKDFWWQWPCSSAFGGDRTERQPQPAGLGLAHQKFLEQQRVRADVFRGSIGTQREQLVAQGQQTARLQPDDGHAARRERRIGRNQPIELRTRLVDQPRREERPPAAQRAAGIDGLRQMDAIAAFDQHAQRGVEIFAFIGAVESVGEQHDFAAIGRPDRLVDRN